MFTWYIGLETSEVGDEGGEEEAEPYEDFAVTLDQFTKYSTWKEVSSLNYGDQSSACSIVSSIEFDKDGEVFAVGGVTKKIKVSSSLSVVDIQTVTIISTLLLLSVKLWCNSRPLSIFTIVLKLMSDSIL